MNWPLFLQIVGFGLTGLSLVILLSPRLEPDHPTAWIIIGAAGLTIGALGAAINK